MILYSWNFGFQTTRGYFVDLLSNILTDDDLYSEKCLQGLVGELRGKRLQWTLELRTV
jgi:hypothetical protein